MTPLLPGRRAWVLGAGLMVAGWFGARAGVLAERPVPKVGDVRVWFACDASRLQVSEEFVHSTYWDLRALPKLAKTTWTVVDPREAPRPHTVVAAPGWLAVRVESEPVGKSALRAARDFMYVDAADPQPDRWNDVAWSASVAGYEETTRTLLHSDAPPTGLKMGDRFTRQTLLRTVNGRQRLTIHEEQVEVIGEGIVLLPAGPRETVLEMVREWDDREPLGVAGAEDGRRLSYRWVCSRQGEVAEVVGPEGQWQPYFEARHARLLGGMSLDQGIRIEKAKMPLVAGKLFLAQYYAPGTTSLATIGGWASAGAMINEFTNLGTPSEMWDFTTVDGGVNYAPFTQDVVVQVRDETIGGGSAVSCADRTGNTCSSWDASANGKWQYYLKFDYWNRPMGASSITRDVYLINDNDGVPTCPGTGPSIDLTEQSQDEKKVTGWTQACFTTGATLAKYLQFNFCVGTSWGMEWDGVNGVAGPDHWTNNWGTCGGSFAARITATQCNGGGTAAKARSVSQCSSSGYGIDLEVIEDGYFRAPSGNIIPALLLRQSTSLRFYASIDVFCFSEQARQRNYDYWWFSEQYGILARVSSPEDTLCTYTNETWPNTDGAYVTFGLFPPYQVTAPGCLGGKVRISWLDPLDRTDFIDNWEVRYGTSPGSYGPPVTVAKGTNFYEVTTASTIYAVVDAVYTYVDPDLVDIKYTSPYSYEVSGAPLSAGSFVVGNTMLETKSGATNMKFDWGAVSGKDHYIIKRGTSPDPATHTIQYNNIPSNTYTTTDGSGGDANTYYYQAFAIDACGNQSSN